MAKILPASTAFPTTISKQGVASATQHQITEIRKPERICHNGSGELRMVPTAQELAQPLISFSDDLCRAHLNEEYAELARILLLKLARKRPSPLLKGKPAIWVGAVIYAIGQNNFLFDKAQTPYMRGEDIAALVGAATSTLAAKAKELRNLVRMRQGYDQDYICPSRLADAPGVWLISMDGFIIDARQLAPEVQDELHRRKLIPNPALLRG